MQLFPRARKSQNLGPTRMQHRKLFKSNDTCGMCGKTLHGALPEFTLSKETMEKCPSQRCGVTVRVWILKNSETMYILRVASEDGFSLCECFTCCMSTDNTQNGGGSYKGNEMTRKKSASFGAIYETAPMESPKGRPAGRPSPISPYSKRGSAVLKLMCCKNKTDVLRKW